MPATEIVNPNGTIQDCICNSCTEIHNAVPPSENWGVTEVDEESTLTECALCHILTDDWIHCDCRPCPHCEESYNSGMGDRMCDPCFTARVMCPACAMMNLVEDTSRCRCGVENLCPTCHRDRHTDCNNAAKIHSYSYKPTPKFAGEGPLFLGVELEVDRSRKGGQGREWARNPNGILDKIGELSDDNNLFYLKDDSSLSNGFEIVTHPCSLDYHRQEFPWESLLEAVKETGLQSHNTNTCGLHIHASRLGFGYSCMMQEKVLGRLMMLWERHWWRYAQMSRRRTKAISSWCTPNREAVDVAEEDMVEMIETVKKPGSRNVTINTSPWENGETGTAEFRLFKGTLQHSSLMAALEIVHHSITISQNWKFDKIATSKWVDVVKDADDRGYKYLTAYVAERGVE